VVDHRILVVGGGSAGQRHLKFAHEYFPNSSIAILSFFSKRLITEKYISKFEEAVKFNPNLVIIANPSTQHLNAFSNLSSLDADFVIEKPLAASLIEAEKLVDIAETQNKRVMVAYQLRFSESLNLVRNLLDMNTIGDLYFADFQIGQSLDQWRPEVDFSSGVSARNDLGGGVLNELSHEIDLLTWFFPNAFLNFSRIATLGDYDIDVENFAELSFEVKKSGKQYLFARIRQDMLRQDFTRKLEIVGELGTLRWDGNCGQVDIYLKSAPEWVTLKRDSRSIHDSLWKGIYDFHTLKFDTPSTLRQSLLTLKIIEQARITSARFS
jgi:predicted dehydrogenase